MKVKHFIPQLFLTITFLQESIYGREYLVSLKQNDSIQSFMDSTITRGRSVKEYLRDKIGKTFSIGSFKGFTVDLTDDLLEAIKKNPLVSDVVPNLRVHAFEGVKDEEGDDDGGQFDNKMQKGKCSVKVQYGAPRHLARLSRRKQLPYDFEDKEAYLDSLKYFYDKRSQGASVNAYIIDSGIYLEHEEFNGRAIPGIDLTGEGSGDYNGHGTHVAGIVGSKSYGVAKKVKLIEIKVLNRLGQGSLAMVLGGIEFAVKHCQETSKKGRCVANLSLGSMRTAILNKAIKAAIDAGLVVVVAAGNNNLNACWYSPASAPEAITVGAFDDRIDAIAKFSNWGQCLDIFAPGVVIKSLSIFKDKEDVTYSGTSMASPTVAGLAALTLDQGVSAEEVKDYILEMGTDNVFHRRSLLFKPGTPNKICFNGVKRNEEEYDDENEEDNEVADTLENIVIPKTGEMPSSIDDSDDKRVAPEEDLVPLGQIHFKRGEENDENRR